MMVVNIRPEGLPYALHTGSLGSSGFPCCVACRITVRWYMHVVLM